LRGTGVHGRTADAVGDLMATAEVVIEVFGQHGVALPFDIAEAVSVLTGSGGAHSATVANSEPVLMFRRTLRELIESGRVQIAERRTGGSPTVNAGAWGWPSKALDAVIGYADIDGAAVGLDADAVYLHRDKTYAVVRDALHKAGETLAFDLNSMWAALVDRELAMVGANAGKSTTQIRVQGAVRRLMKCKVAILSEDDSDAAAGARDVKPDSDDSNEPF
jgi:hypothetical protein